MWSRGGASESFQLPSASKNGSSVATFNERVPPMEANFRVSCRWEGLSFSAPHEPDTSPFPEPLVEDENARAIQASRVLIRAAADEGDLDLVDQMQSAPLFDHGYALRESRRAQLIFADKRGVILSADERETLAKTAESAENPLDTTSDAEVRADP